MRRYDIDWLRVIVILLLIPFHAAMPFVTEWDWLLKNDELSPLLLDFNYFIHVWRLPLLFIISGIGTTFALKNISEKQYIIQRTKRLLVPLIVGLYIIIPPAIYLSRLYQGWEYSSFFDFYPSIFTTGMYPPGNLSWDHLWFIAYLYIFSIVAIPLFILIKYREKKIFSSNSKGYWYLWFIIPLYLSLILSIRYPQNLAFINDWATLLRYFLYFIMGYLIGIEEDVWNRIEHHRKLYLSFAFLFTLLIFYFRWNGKVPITEFSVSYVSYLGLMTLNTWCWVFSILGYAKKYLNFSNKFLRYANEGIYPFYILHQTFIVIAAYCAIQTTESIIAKYLFIVIVAYFLTIITYHCFVRSYKIPRFLLGMKAEKINIK